MAPSSKMSRPAPSTRKGSSSRNPRSSSGRAIGRYAEDAWSVAQRTAAGLNQIRRLINVDHKMISTKAATTSTQAGVVNYILPVAQGVDRDNRIGDSLRIQTIELRAVVARNGSDGTARLVLVRDTANRQANPAGSDLLTEAGGAYATISGFNYFNKNPNAEKNRFVILYDESVIITANDTNQLLYHVSPGKHVRFGGTGATVASAGEGAMFLFIFTDQAANAPIVTWQTQIYYTDD